MVAARARDAVPQDLGDPRRAEAHDARGRAGPGAAGHLPGLPRARQGAPGRLLLDEAVGGVRPGGADGEEPLDLVAPVVEHRLGMGERRTREDRASSAEHERRSEGTEHGAPHRAILPTPRTLRATDRKASGHQRFWRCAAPRPRARPRRVPRQAGRVGVMGPRDERPRRRLSLPLAIGVPIYSRALRRNRSARGPARRATDPTRRTCITQQRIAVPQERPVPPVAAPAPTHPRPLTFIASGAGLIVAFLCLPVVLLAGGPLNGWILGVALWSANWALQIFTAKIAINSSATAAVGLSGISFISRAWLMAIILFVIALKLRRDRRPHRRRRVPGRLHLRPRRPHAALRHEPERPQGRAPVSHARRVWTLAARARPDAHARAARPRGGGRGQVRPVRRVRDRSLHLDRARSARPLDQQGGHLPPAGRRHLHRRRHLRHPRRPEDAAHAAPRTSWSSSTSSPSSRSPARRCPRRSSPATSRTSRRCSCSWRSAT